MSSPSDREFRVLPRGDIRDRVILGNFRAGLRNMVSPDTGLPFTEEEIARATQAGTRFYVGADAIDSYGQGEQRRALFLYDQIQIDRASTAWLENYHAKLWAKPKLPAEPGGGNVLVTGVPGTLILGSGTIPDPTAYTARDPAGNTFQVLTGSSIGTDGTATVTMICQSTGTATNLAVGTKLNWATRAPGMDPSATVATAFVGGTPDETDGDQADRIIAGIRYRESAGNPPQLRAWARASSSGVEDAWVYPCAMHSGTTVIAITQQRGATVGPLARVPAFATLQSAIRYLTPPGSTLVPRSVGILVTGVTASPAPVVLQVALRKGSTVGWTDAAPFPSYHATTPATATVYGATPASSFTLTALADTSLPISTGVLVDGSGHQYLEGDNAPHLMLYRASLGSFDKLNVSRVTLLSAGSFQVTLTSPIVFGSDTIICPDTALRGDIAAAVMGYMDSRGPGEIVASTDERWYRAQRFPSSDQDWPTGIGADVATAVLSALGGASASVQLMSAPVAPLVPGSPTGGPVLVTLGSLGVYAT